MGSATIKGASEIGSRLSSATIKGASEIGNRLGSAAKAAWKEVITPKHNSEKELNQSASQAQSDTPDKVISEENHVHTIEVAVSDSTPENNLPKKE